jgi:hypothetical protein
MRAAHPDRHARVRPLDRLARAGGVGEGLGEEPVSRARIAAPRVVKADAPPVLQRPEIRESRQRTGVAGTSLDQRPEARFRPVDRRVAAAARDAGGED